MKKYIVCKKCGFENLPGTQFCQRCGSKISLKFTVKIASSLQVPGRMAVHWLRLVQWRSKLRQKNWEKQLLRRNWFL